MNIVKKDLNHLKNICYEKAMTSDFDRSNRQNDSAMTVEMSKCSFVKTIAISLYAL